MVALDPLASELTAPVTYKIQAAYDEDYVAQAIPTVAPKDYTTVIIYTLAVFFSLVILLVLGAAVLYLLRK